MDNSNTLECGKIISTGDIFSQVLDLEMEYPNFALKVDEFSRIKHLGIVKGKGTSIANSVNPDKMLLLDAASGQGLHCLQQ